MLRRLGVGLLLAGSAAVAGAAGPEAELIEGQGRDMVAVACAQCHSLSTITHLRLGEAAWRGYVYDMVARGTQLTEPEAETVIAYLAAQYGPGSELPRAALRSVELPEAAGKAQVEANCAVCHDLFKAVGTRRSKAEWSHVVDKMDRYGLTMSPRDRAVIIRYLGTHFEAQPPAATAMDRKK
jgi:mono/diheme cytochrome c family protein